ncbi:branched-chain amino acid ABC transporter permease [Ensifer adhaerens]|uniref:branched-chain amino acid ABC transporter permease n=1 Tax=Ensifer adhaerens TaxID=106592 RepID=UPI001CBC03F7|nr:branched-chain amino acid ABC transporter permease [Ensifer adhaerens]MBZ7924303.1 branched-chain amino acid ABC transporter permease [Ensifer adhaerens]UAX96446.1 branched-chain amino acid ABC transporter permease [Ensifer adhaerens]UAY04211.1 branched-chain amino acid ABC transporter permease [Ensifer adhaerens]UAY12197.1 branched-chain amino acid ABC transporter permease [Ensifer adhaerens]
MTLGLILADGLVYAAWLFIISIGLTLICGVMKILNVAHGAVYAIGAYTAAAAIGAYAQSGLPAAWVYVIMALSAVLTGGVVGLLLERIVLRQLYSRDEIIAVLATFAIFLILEDLLLMVFGRQTIFAYAPYTALGSLQIGDLVVARYDVALIILAAVMAAGLWWFLHRTKFGRILFVVIYSRETATAFGVDVRKVFVATFVAGSILAALGGAFTAPKISVAPGMGVEVIVIAFAIVAVGGMGSIQGALAAALLVGVFRAAAVHLVPSIEMFVVYLVMAAVLAVRPYGLFTRSKPRVI